MIKRYYKNPILTKDDFHFDNEDIQVLLAFNPGVIKRDNKVHLLVRVAISAKEKEGYLGVPIFNKESGKIEILYFDKNDSECDFSDVRLIKKQGEVFLTTLSYIALATSENGIDFDVKQTPFIMGDNEYETFGVEDPRITFIDGWYYINYSGVSKDGICTMLARTKDFVNVEKLGVAFMPDNKDVVIFPEKINGKYVALSRPESAYFRRPNVWISYSKDMLCWGEHNLLLTLRENCFDSARIGASCVPFKTEWGWLEIYHGATINNEYCLGAVLFDLNDPKKIIARSKEAIMSPSEPYEREGFMPNVIFACGCYVEDDNVHLYYGACDESICYACLSVKQIIEKIMRDSNEN